MTNHEYLLDAISAVTDGCVAWPYAKDSNGYGCVWMDGKSRRAHVVALELTTPHPIGKVCSIKGDWVPGHRLHAAHGSCHNRACINTSHLSWKTPAENAADKKRDGTHQANEANGQCKLPDADVDRIRSLWKGPQNRYNRTGPTQRELADQFGCSKAQICNIINGNRRGAA